MEAGVSASDVRSWILRTLRSILNRREIEGQIGSSESDLEALRQILDENEDDSQDCRMSHDFGQAIKAFWKDETNKLQMRHSLMDSRTALAALEL
jgi:hypothetical protein